MIQETNIRIPPKYIEDKQEIKKSLAQQLKVPVQKIIDFKILKKSIDARSKKIVFQLRIQVGIQEKIPTTLTQYSVKKDVSKSPSVIIVGAGPAGLFAALELIELGLKPIILERGKNVRERRRDLAAINKKHLVNPDSNYCFGEGGAGTYSDGKLYTRSDKRGNVKKVLSIFIEHGADETIGVEAHPHIGTNKLPKIITSIRDFIIECGGEIHFNTRVENFKINKNKIVGVQTNKDDFNARELILATGHSARDIFKKLDKLGIAVENKPFALGVRIEHPQSLIDSIQYKCDERGDFLPPAAYNLVSQTQFKPAYSFCMCPGGIIAPCATSPGEVVTNGWSPSKRNNPYANSGIVVTVDEKDFQPYSKYGSLAAMRFQASIEKKAWISGGRSQVAPAQKMADFVSGKISSSLPKTSYQPGIISADLTEVFPSVIVKSLQEAFLNFGKKMNGYFTNEAVLHATESRTSSPVKIPRDKTSLEHIQIKGLYPCGEGAGYAGGIMSAAIDGQKCAQKIADKYRTS
ncbi:MAG: FAD-binding protein [Flavobacteriales bacterium]|nr:FAD-binding protein [Flavobacteriales bacterium]